jgi:hypothetical protein
MYVNDELIKVLSYLDGEFASRLVLTAKARSIQQGKKNIRYEITTVTVDSLPLSSHLALMEQITLLEKIASLKQIDYGHYCL